MGTQDLQVHNCVFFCVHHEKGWLGASPDARVSDPDSSQWNGIAEFKCPFSKADVPVETACKDPECIHHLRHGVTFVYILLRA